MSSYYQNLKPPLFFLTIICLGLSLMFGCGGGDDADLLQVPPKYTLMVYMVGSDLESKENLATNDLSEMMDIGSTEKFNVLVTTGGANKDGWRTVNRYKILKNFMSPISILGNLNMGDPNTLKDFIVWGTTNYPADRYALILWDHGAGAIGGFGVDENHSDLLTLPEIDQALSDAKAQNNIIFNVIGFDACLMATVEVANTLAPYSKYMVASEEVEPGTGWNYYQILDAISSNLSITGSELGEIIVASYAASLMYQEHFKFITLSVTDLSKIPLVVSSLNSLSNVIDESIEFEDINNRENWMSIIDSRAKGEDYGNDEANGRFTDMVDVKHLASLLSTDAYYHFEAIDLISAIDDAITYKFSGYSRPNSNGLSIYFPYHMNYDLYYDNVNFSSTYKNMLKNYLTLRDTDSPFFSPINLSGYTVTSQILSEDVNDEEIYVLLTTTSDPNNITFIGMIPPDDFDNSGNISFEWDGLWLALESGSSWVFAPCFIIDEENQLYLFDIPAKLNGEVIDLLAYIDLNVFEMSVIGAWPGIDDNGSAVKNFIQIQTGDNITPLWLNYNIIGDSFDFVDGTALTVASDGINLGIYELPIDTYQIWFCATDFSGNFGMTDNYAEFDVLSKIRRKSLNSQLKQYVNTDIIQDTISSAGIARSIFQKQETIKQKY